MSEIPDSNPAPRQGSGEDWILLNTKTGDLEFEPGKDKPKESYGAIKGFLQRTWMEWDPGNDTGDPRTSVPARWVVNVKVQTKGRAALLKGLGTDVPFISLGAALRTLPKGQVVFIGSRKEEDGASCFFDVSFFDGEHWHECDVKEIWDKDKIAKENRRVTVEQWVSKCPTYSEPVEVTHDHKQRPIKYYLGGTSSAAAPTDPPKQPQNPPSNNPSRPVPPDGKVAFGWVPQRWFKAEETSMDAAATQHMAYSKKAESRNLNSAQAKILGDKVLEVLGIARAVGQPWTAAHLLLAYDFLAGADDEQLANAKLAAMPASAPVDNDPFAD